MEETWKDFDFRVLFYICVARLKMCGVARLLSQIVWVCTRIRPSQNREGLGCGCVDQILSRMRCLVYMYVCMRTR